MKGRQTTVLIVDDNADAAESMLRVVQLLGYPVSYVTDPRDAIAEIESARPDIVFLDLAMPFIDGLTLARVIRATYAQEQPILVALTAFDDPEDRAITQRAGFCAHVAKPADPALIEAMIARLCPAGAPPS
jgi:CheY-like chemotaxis protein